MGKKCNRRSGIHSKIGAGCLPKADRALLAETEAFVKKELHAQDGSHDWFHIHRVRNLALKLARMEGINNRLVVELAALLHDIRDWKYSGDENEGIVEVEKFLGSKNCPKCVTEQVLHIVKNIGFKNELAAERANGDSKLIITPELAVVQDADRLDAIGAIGIARTFTYGGSRNRALYDPDIKPCINITKEQYMKKGRNEPTINHFYEKLLKLKTKMKSKSGRQVAEGRHKYMEEYLEKFCREWSGEE
eukprot:jgi/Bigna1/76801/fgenesh1_pg.44_\